MPYLSLVDSDGPTNAAGLPTHLIAFAVHLRCIMSVITCLDLTPAHAHRGHGEERALTLSSISIRCAFSRFSLRRIFSMSHWSSSIRTCSSLIRWSALLAARTRGRDWTRQERRHLPHTHTHTRRLKEILPNVLLFNKFIQESHTFVGLLRLAEPEVGGGTHTEQGRT